LILLLLNAAPARAQLPDRDLIPESAFAAVMVQFQDAMHQPSMELVPREIISVAGREQLGIDPMEIVTVTFLVDSFETMQQPPGFAAIVRFENPPVLTEQLIGPGVEPEQLNGKPIYRFGGPDKPVLYLHEPQTLIVGMEPFIGKMIAASGVSSDLTSLVDAHDEPQHIQIFVAVGPMRERIKENLPSPDQVPPQFQSVLELPDLIDNLVIESSLAEDAFSRLEIGAASADAAARIDEIRIEGIQVIRDLVLAQIASSDFPQSPEMADAIEQYVERISRWVEAQLRPDIQGNRLVYQQEGNATFATAGILMGLLMPAVQSARAAANRVESQNNLRQIVLAAHNYHDAYGHFPSDIRAEDGTRLLSWRVALLPFMEEAALYEQFHLDEPWDSEHNLELLDRMPAIYQPGLGEAIPGWTTIQGFRGPDTVFGEEQVQLRDIHDGTSNTIFCVETGLEQAVEWTRPADLAFDPEGPLPEIGMMYPAGFCAAFCDGSVRTIDYGIDAEALRLMILMNDGESILGDEPVPDRQSR
jgi:hypothetical protein